MADLKKIAEGKNFVLYENTGNGEKLIKLENIRFSYPHFGAQKEDENDDGEKSLSWGGVAMLPKGSHEVAKMQLDKLILDLKKTNGDKGKMAFIDDDKLFIKDGDKKEDETMHGHWLVTFSQKGRYRPDCRNAVGDRMDDIGEIDDEFYGGAWGHVLIRPWFFAGKAKNSKKTYPKRISAGYTGVQKTKDDTPFGGGRVDDSTAWGDESKANSSGSDGMSGGSSSSSDDDF